MCWSLSFIESYSYHWSGLTDSFCLRWAHLGGSQRYDGPAKLDFSFMSNGDDEGLPDELYEVIITTNIQPFQPSSLVPVMDALLIVIFVFVFFFFPTFSRRRILNCRQLRCLSISWLPRRWVPLPPASSVTKTVYHRQPTAHPKRNRPVTVFYTMSFSEFRKRLPWLPRNSLDHLSGDLSPCSTKPHPTQGYVVIVVVVDDDSMTGKAKKGQVFLSELLSFVDEKSLLRLTGTTVSCCSWFVPSRWGHRIEPSGPSRPSRPEITHETITGDPDGKIPFLFYLSKYLFHDVFDIFLLPPFGLFSSDILSKSISSRV